MTLHFRNKREREKYNKQTSFERNKDNLQEKLTEVKEDDTRGLSIENEELILQSDTDQEYQNDQLDQN